MPKKVEIRNFSPDQLTKYYDDYCLKNNIEMKTEVARKIWWAMFYTWRDGKEWVEYE